MPPEHSGSILLIAGSQTRRCSGLGGLAGALIGDAKGEDFSQGHFVDVIGRGTGGWGMIGRVEGTALGFDRPTYRPAESCQLLNFRLVTGKGCGSFGDYVVFTGVDRDGATWVLIQIGALARALAAGEIIRLVDEEGADRGGVDLAPATAPAPVAGDGREPACAASIGELESSLTTSLQSSALAFLMGGWVCWYG